ncbi:Capsule polysaccharide export protein KpsE/RkpR [Paracoccus isoporae]|uniref:Capsule polysaccharide export protein KpsE/RkpR n=1 Tax=Paracoccus isoporae TaxID=591205 RepID=A0A1G7CTG9_9RHOB|nr:hypothetical protein [Paracoccus isoporae]SDE42060.1 Capsule polysaccharide export protein KpsE/RkpR [Paracoccus isoporae]
MTDAAATAQGPQAQQMHSFGDVGPARLKLRHYFLIAAFVVMVILPSVLTAYLSWNFAGTLRQVTASVTVQEHSLGAFGNTDDSAAVQSAFKGSGGEETAIIRQLVHSEDFFRTIEAQLDLTQIWPTERRVPYLPTRYDPDDKAERRHDFWRNMVEVNIGSRDQIIRLRVSAFDQQSAERLLQAIRIEAERRLNVARSATLSAAIKEATARLEELREKNADDRQRLKEFRLRNRAIDPMVLAMLNAEFINFLRAMQAEEEIRIAEAEASVSQQRELVRRSQDRMAAINAYLDNPDSIQGEIVSADEVTALIAEYQPLLTEAELSGMSLRMSELAIIRYQQELQSTKVFLSSVTGGSMASIEVFPEFLPSLLLVAVGSFVLWVILLLLFYGIRDRK